eukprot:TRINITY_DN1341_c0_g1_i10.p1 TRINITY_DN1341_c0_g1~~TRINITY_DN1341_c0_g1_i10.p1  ORF type:complete len:262 (+),score=42.04 TRINITY_DN1341_c0_g1_i10:76-861(+)
MPTERLLRLAGALEPAAGAQKGAGGLQLFVRMIDGSLEPHDVDPSGTVADLLAALSGRVTRLRYGGRELRPDDLLADTGVSSQAVLEADVCRWRWDPETVYAMSGKPLFDVSDSGKEALKSVSDGYITTVAMTENVMSGRSSCTFHVTGLSQRLGDMDFGIEDRSVFPTGGWVRHRAAACVAFGTEKPSHRHSAYVDLSELGASDSMHVHMEHEDGTMTVRITLPTADTITREFAMAPFDPSAYTWCCAIRNVGVTVECAG